MFKKIAAFLFAAGAALSFSVHASGPDSPLSANASCSIASNSASRPAWKIIRLAKRNACARRVTDARMQYPFADAY